MASTPERKLKDEITKWLRSQGIWWDMGVRIGYGRNGVPDILCCVKGAFIALEVKAGKNVPTPWQRRELAAIVKAGGKAAVVRSLQEVKDLVGHRDQDLE